jgi:hypothetical protein
MVSFTAMNIYRAAEKVLYIQRHRSGRAGNMMTDCQSRRRGWNVVVDDRAAS